MSEPKFHHFVPVMHLKHFVGPTPPGQVWTYDADLDRAWSSVPEETGGQRDFYSIERDDGMMDTAVEKCLSTVESAAAPVYEALLRGNIPAKGTQERVDFAAFLALMFMRTPGMRRMIGEVLGRNIQIMGYAYGISDTAFEALNRRAEADGGRKLNADERERVRQTLIDPSGYALQLPKERTLPVLLNTANGLVPVFHNMKWTLVEAAHGFFITSDNPVVKDVDPKSVSPFYGDGGFANKTIEVIFPMSPKRALMMTWRESFPDTATVPGDYAWRVNQALAANSDRQLYAHIEDERLRKLSTEFKHTKPGMTTQGFGPEKFAKVDVPRRIGHPPTT